MEVLDIAPYQCDIYRVGNIRYEGEYKDDIVNFYPKNGKGIEYEKDGETIVYEGEYSNNLRCGKGNFYKNGQLWYEGNWKDNLPNGYGKLYGKNDEVLYDGEWIGGHLYEKPYKISYKTGKKVLSFKPPKASQSSENCCETCASTIESGWENTLSCCKCCGGTLSGSLSSFYKNVLSLNTFRIPFLIVLFVALVLCFIFCSVNNYEGYAFTYSWISMVVSFQVLFIVFCLLKYDLKSSRVISIILFCILTISLLVLLIVVGNQISQIKKQKGITSILSNKIISSIAANQKKWIASQESLKCCGYNGNFKTGSFCYTEKPVDCFNRYLMKWRSSYSWLLAQFSCLILWSFSVFLIIW